MCSSDLDLDWIVIVTEQENLKYTEKACERFLEIHPDNKYRKLITRMLDFAKKEIQGGDESRFATCFNKNNLSGTVELVDHYKNND